MMVKLNTILLDRKKSILKVTKSEDKAINNANDTQHKYFWDGDDWWYDSQTISIAFDTMILLDEVI